MDNALLWILLSIGFSAVMWIPYILNVIARMGIKALSYAPRPQLAGWAERAQRAHINAVENLVIFVPLSLMYYGLTQQNTGFFAKLCLGYFILRVIHYFSMLLKVPIIRTLAFVGGWVISIILFIDLLPVVYQMSS